MESFLLFLFASFYIAAAIFNLLRLYTNNYFSKEEVIYFLNLYIYSITVCSLFYGRFLIFIFFTLFLLLIILCLYITNFISKYELFYYIRDYIILNLISYFIIVILNLYF
jgi:hypothetical protein